MSDITIYGADWCGDCIRTKRQLDGLGVGYDWVDVENDDAARETAIEIAGRKNIPVVVFTDGAFLVEPSATDMEAALRERSLL